MPDSSVLCPQIIIIRQKASAGFLVQCEEKSLYRVDENLSALVTPMWDGDEKFRPLWNKKTCPCARSRGVMGNSVVVIGILLFENIDEALATYHVYPILGRIVEEVVGIA